MKAVLFFVFFTTVALGASGQRVFTPGELDKVQSLERRPTIVLIGTPWCKFCQAMKSSVIRHKGIAQLAERAYVVSLNAEDKSGINFAGRLFEYDKRFRTHQLAMFLAGSNEVTYPTVVVLGQQSETLGMHQGYLAPDAFSTFLAESFKRVTQTALKPK